MSKWSLSLLLENLHKNLTRELEIARESFEHPGTKGDCSENVWIDLFNTYLPERYRAIKAHIVDSKNNFSQQMDIVIFDRQYSPFVFTFKEQNIIPIESVYAVFEAKQTINSKMVSYANEKINSVRALCPTSLPIPHAGGCYPAKPPINIIGGILTLESDWKPPLGDFLHESLAKEGILDMGCTATHGYFIKNEDTTYSLINSDKAVTAFLFQLISRLQSCGTVPMIDILAYSKWL
ncbi:DUF6602 domain-containing protein [Neisseria sp. Ec49-e6-T10]|uniref:DUF6602 domain-containing protein n=1 Tax=Neisseria sp. Ec49-e6-T10 TaxID=3140744 RepID=UPI003EB97F70